MWGGWALAALVGRLLLPDVNAAGVLRRTAASERVRETRVLVRVSPRISSADVARLVSAMRAQVQDLATVDSGADVAGALCVVDIEPAPAGVSLVLRDPSGRSAGARRVVAAGGEIGASEAAAVVRAFVVASRERVGAASAEPASTASSTAVVQPVDPPTSVPSSPAASTLPATSNVGGPSAPQGAAPTAAKNAGNGPAPMPAASSPSRETVSGAARAPAAGRVRATAAYTATRYADEVPWQSGIRFEGAFAMTPAAYVGLGYAFHPAVEVASDAVSARLTRHAASVFVGLERQGRMVSFGADVAAGMDDTLRTTSRAGAGFSGTADASSLSPAFALRLHGRWRVPQIRGVSLDFAPAFEVAPGARDLVVEGAGGSSTALLRPTVARARLDVGASFETF